MSLEQVLSLLRTMTLIALVGVIWHLAENQQMTIMAVNRLVNTLVQVEMAPETAETPTESGEDSQHDGKP